MIYRQCGGTGDSLSAIGFGGMRFENQDDIDLSASLVTSAHEAGINYFDTAPLYGKSEDIFGTAFKSMLKTRAEKPFFVSTKTFKSKPSEIRADLEKSLKRMGLDHVDFFHMWNVSSLDDYRERKAAGALREFEKLKSEGLIRHVCASTHMTGDDIAAMLDDHPFESVLLGFSAMNFPYREHGVMAAKKKGVGVMAMNPLGGGLIPNNPERFKFLKTDDSQSVAGAALNFILNHPGVTLALNGVANKKQLDEAVRVLRSFKPLDETQVARIRKAVCYAMDRLCTSCGYCRGCPADVPIMKLMDAFNMSVLNPSPDPDKTMLDRLRNHWNIDPADKALRACTSCGRCEKLCTQKLPVMERIALIRDAADKALRS